MNAAVGPAEGGRGVLVEGAVTHGFQSKATPCQCRKLIFRSNSSLNLRARGRGFGDEGTRNPKEIADPVPEARSASATG